MKTNRKANRLVRTIAIFSASVMRRLRSIKNRSTILATCNLNLEEDKVPKAPKNLLLSKDRLDL